ncbi:MAG: hypothetical protein ACFFDN_45980 [Candidatus Hodarchaeota archaeon]
MEILKLLLVILCLSLFSSYFTDTKPGDVWLQMSNSQRVGYLVGYVQGVDTGVDVGEDYDGVMYESFFNSKIEYRNIILKRTTELYKEKENRSVPLLHMILLAYLELQGEPKAVIEMRLQMAKEISKPYLGTKDVKQGDYWLQFSQEDRQAYLDGLIEGIQWGIHLGKQNDLKMITLFDNNFNLGEEIEAIAEVVTEIVQDNEYKNMQYHYLFPLAFMRYSYSDESVIKDFLKEIRERMKKGK